MTHVCEQSLMRDWNFLREPRVKCQLCDYVIRGAASAHLGRPVARQMDRDMVVTVQQAKEMGWQVLPARGGRIQPADICPRCWQEIKERQAAG